MDDAPEALVFDYDGVLADTESLHWKSWAALLSRYDIQFTWAEYCSFGRGISDAQMCEALRKRSPLLDPTELLRQNFERRRMVREWSLEEIPIPAEMIKLLMTLTGYRIGLVTNSERSDVEPILRATAIYERFDAMVFGEDTPTHKPDPDPYLLIAQKLGVATGLAFEDSAAGVESALAAGFKVVKVERPEELAQIVARSLQCQLGP
jgi:HAD superfamily hydrolase (TIGR01509 family)